MTRPDLRRLAELVPDLDTALALAPAARGQWLSALRQRDPGTAARLAEMLAREPELDARRFLEEQAHVVPRQMASLAGQRLGAYLLERSLGRGGMGSVWLGRRCDGRYEGVAAIKLLNLALIDDTGIERFRREGTALARLRHPNIAHLLDSGVTDSGQPYLVLEYVEGVRIDRHADDLRLGPLARLELFRQVLAPVAHAHSNLVVHRDLKPSNILVTPDGTVKLLDFGIAKLLQQEVDETRPPELTEQGHAPLTPEYAAPEQIRGEPITTAADLYSLGVLLYVLLSGRHPTSEVERGVAARLQAVVDTEPAPLSRVVSEASSGGAVSPARLRRLFAGDLDRILAKALRKDPAERYVSIAAFDADLGRYLRHEPVEARPASLGYRTAMFIRRNRTAVVAGAAVVAMLVAGVVATFTQMLEAQRQRDHAFAQQARAEYQANRALATSRFMTSMLTAIAPDERGLSVSDLLARAESLLAKNYATDSLLSARMMLELSDHYFYRYGGPRQRSLDLRAAALARGAGDPDVAAQAECRLALHGAAADSPAVLVRRAEDRLREVRDPDPRTRIYCLLAQSALYPASSDSGDVMIRRALSLAEERGDTVSLAMFRSLDFLSSKLARSPNARLQDALALHQRRIRLLRSAGLDRSTLMADALGALHWTYMRLGELRAADSVLGELELLVVGDSVARGRVQVTRALIGPRLGRYRAALDQLRRSSAEARARGNLAFANFLETNVVVLLSDSGLAAEAAQVMLQIREGRAVLDSALLFRTEGALASARGEHEAALEWYRRSIAATDVAQPVTREALQLTLYRAAGAALAAGDASAADSLAREARRVQQSIQQVESRSADMGRSLVLQARARLALGDSALAASLLGRALPGLSNGLGLDNAETLAVRKLLSRLPAHHSPLSTNHSQMGPVGLEPTT